MQAPTPFTRRKLIRFAHCDPAGIVFYPRYAELCNEVVEDWFREALAVDFHHLHETLGLGIPTVRLEVDYLRPSRYGDNLDFSLSVASVGKSSLGLALSACHQGVERVRFRLTVVMVSLDTLKSVPLDEDWRARFTPFLATPSTPGP